MFRLAAAFTLILATTSAAPPDLNTTLGNIENHYNKISTLKLDFSETYAAGRRPAQNESGTLYLRKPGRMRWEYSTPAGKIFLADGKYTWLYVPEDHRVEKAQLKMSEDMRAPLAFLLGRLDFHRDFKSFETHQDGWIIALPKSQNLPYTQVDFLATPQGQIQKIRVTNQDLSKLEFTFSNEQLNPAVAPGLFVFKPAPGVDVVEVQP